MKVYDYFTFYNEFELLELRLKSLWDMVDCFVIVEADKTHTNQPKPYYFWERQDEFKKFWSKIRHLPVEMTVPFKGVGDWSIENAQRDAIIYGLKDAKPDDLIFISDADEIPSPDVLQRIYSNQASVILMCPMPVFRGREQKSIAFSIKIATQLLEEYSLVMDQKFLCYYFDWSCRGNWRGTVLTKRKNLTMPQELRELRNELPFIPDGGWHFSYMGGVDRVINKMNSVVEGKILVNQSGGKLIDKKSVEKALSDGREVYGRLDSSAYEFYDAKNICLPCLNEFLKKYSYLLREPEKYFGG